ncbi:MAG TPA: VCBS repeat-containing protein [Chthoniobacteraceae bacterium]|jgi:hypothetical protein|nr:VCBS repeat-containing protein [Chthoniobacteraceae bacterium]
MTKHVLTMLLALLVAVHAGPVRFERVGGEQNGTAAAFEAWYRLEMERQGGPGQSHGWWPWGLRAFDFDGDGLPDLLASHHGLPHSMLLRGTRGPAGALTFTDVTRQLGLDYRDLPGADERPWVWDFDGDGHLDIVGISNEATAGCAWNQAGRSFRATPGSLLKSLAHPQEVIDLDGDGFLDVDGGAKGQWFYVPATKTFRHDPQPRFPVPDGIAPEVLAPFETLQKTTRFFYVDYLTHDLVGFDTLGYDARPIDLDGDGRRDVVVRGSGGYGAEYLARYLLRQPDGRLADRTDVLGLPPAGAPILIRDLTGDGLPEILVVANKAGEAAGGLFLNDGKGAFHRVDGPLSEFLDRRGPYLIRAYPADFDDDGRPDLVLSNPRLGVAVVYHNEGGGRFAEVLKLTECWDSNPIVIADFDGDGRTDLAIGIRAKGTPGEIQLFLNRTENAGHFLSIVPRMAAPNPFAVGAVIEVYPAGDLAKGARPLFVEKAHLDATPVHAGLGVRTRCGVRVTFPGGKTVERNNQEVDRSLTITP